MFEISDGGGPEDGRPTLPFARQELDGEDAVIIHMKVLSTDLALAREAYRMVNRAIEGRRVNGRPISVVVTNDSVDMNITDMRHIAAHITPHVMRALGLPGQ